MIQFIKGPYEVNFQMLIEKCESVGLQHYNYSKVYIG